MPNEPEPTDEELEERLRKLLGEAESAGADEMDEIELKLRDVEESLSARQEARKENDDLFDAEFEGRLRALHERADRAKDAQRSREREQSRERASTMSSSKGLGVGLSIAYAITGLPLAGVAIGWLVDRSLGTDMWKGIGMLIGAVGGLVMAFVVLGRTQQEK